MKVRVIKKDDEFIPQYWDEDGGKFGPKWKNVHLRDDLVPEYWFTLEEAQRACYEFEEKHRQDHGEIVWETEIRSW